MDRMDRIEELRKGIKEKIFQLKKGLFISLEKQETTSASVEILQKGLLRVIERLSVPQEVKRAAIGLTQKSFELYDVEKSPLERDKSREIDIENLQKIILEHLAPNRENIEPNLSVLRGLLEDHLEIILGNLSGTPEELKEKMGEIFGQSWSAITHRVNTALVLPLCAIGSLSYFLQQGGDIRKK